jgi:ATP-dependent DNA ligase
MFRFRSPRKNPRACTFRERVKPDTLLVGEIVAMDENGRVSFNLLQNHRSRAAAVQFYAFGIIMCDRKSLLRVPVELWLERAIEVGPAKNSTPFATSRDGFKTSSPTSAHTDRTSSAQQK